MKAVTVAGALALGLVATSAQADVIFGVKAGYDYWSGDMSGHSTPINSTSTDHVHYAGDSQSRLWASVEHPVPLVPNVELRYSMIEDTATIGAQAHQADLSNLDLILYYEILDNDFVALDVGGAWKQMQGKSTDADFDIDKGVFMGYAEAEVGMPFFGLYGFADVLAGVNESSVYDYAVGLGWNFGLILVDVKLRAGYRDFNFEIDDFSGHNINQQVDGYFVGLEFDF